ncbi:hypothetical protein IWQ47_000714 [Aquimarina sp. EL_43]|nr:hypothetical protein [Aquimarina sp. EL_35]MBG6149659.1 hypothetical protein [Aquimarina sp. EL_32]MBG6167656.1 hypothetical protein [Aquimarina sp. EL_43]
MKNLYATFGLTFRAFISFVKELPGASLYAMRR